jgi:hypothetical protein
VSDDQERRDLEEVRDALKRAQEALERLEETMRERSGNAERDKDEDDWDPRKTERRNR